MIKNWTPLTSINFKDSIADNVLSPVQLAISGELTLGVSKYNMGAARVAGVVTKVWMSVNASGKDDTNPLQLSGEVFINGTTCLSTLASIAHVSGEASQQKTTVVTGDTGVTQAVLDYDANSFSAGDVFTCDLTLVRSATPTTEMNSPVIVVEFNPS